MTMGRALDSTVCLLGLPSHLCMAQGRSLSHETRGLTQGSTKAG